ncbi:MAG: DMT family transporter [Candidatus Baltobacteraceae bacterium]
MPYALLGGAQLAVGAAAIFARYALGGAQPIAVSAARLAIAALVLFAIAAFRLRAANAGPVTRRQNFILALAGVALAAHFAGWIWSLEYTTVATSTLLVASTPVWTALYDAAFGKNRLSRAAMAAFATGAAGLVMVVGFNHARPPFPGHELLGALLALGGSVAIAAYLLLVREVRARTNTRAIVTRTYGWAALVLVASAALAHQPPPPVSDTAAWGGIIAMALISQLLGHTAINASLRWFSPSAVSFASLLEPVFAAMLALALFHESVAAPALAGAVLLLGSIAVVLREEHKALDGSGLYIGPVQ